MDLHFVLVPLPLAHYYFCGSYRDVREIIVIHGIIVI